MARLSRLTLVFAILFAVLVIGLPFLSSPFGSFPLMKTQDAADLLTPLILIPVYWLLFQIDPQKPVRQGETIVFLVLASLWVEGQGMHLSANSIGHLVEQYSGSDAAALTYFYDEVLSHYLWHAGVIGLSLLLILRQWRHPFEGSPSGAGTAIGAGVLHGLNFGLMVLEGATTAIGVPAAAIVVIFVLGWGRAHLRQQPLLLFFFVAYLVAVVLFLAWRVYWGCFLEPFDALQRLGTRGC